jgi:hypothetical protein
MASSQKKKKGDVKPEPHTEKSTMTEPQEEFIEQKGRPSRPVSPPQSRPEYKDKEQPGKQAQE